MLATTSSIVIIGKCSLWIAYFKSLGSIQIRILFALTTETMLLTQSVGSVCLTITPVCSIRSSSSLILSLRDTGTFLGGWTTAGTLGSTLIVCSPGMHPSPWNRSEYSCNMFGFATVGHSGMQCCLLGWESCNWCILTSNPISLQVCALHTAGASTLTTWNCTLYTLPLCSQGNVTTPLVGIWSPEYDFKLIWVFSKWHWIPRSSITL